MPNGPHVIGVDVSLVATGVASSHEWCETVGREKVTVMGIEDKVAAVDGLARDILTLCQGADLVVIEAPQTGKSYGGLVERIALTWLVVRALTHAERRIALVAPSGRARYACGKGNASKSAVVDAVARRWPQFVTTGNDNLADAVVLCAMGRDWLGAPMGTVPQNHRDALSKVIWPTGGNDGD